jgi:hypothetical protein
MAKTYEDQALLVVQCPGGIWAVLAVLGEIVRDHLDEYGPIDLGIPLGIPDPVGLYVWEGQCELASDRNYSLRGNTTWFGSWRPAVLGDFTRFGLPVPLPRLAEGVLA